MNSPGISEIIVIGIVLLLAVGPERLPHVVRTLGRLYGRMRRAAEDLRRSLVLEADRMDEEERLKDLKRRRAAAEADRKRAEEEHGSSAQPVADPAVRVPRPSRPAVPPASQHVPAGFTEAEWQELPPHIRQLITAKGVMGEQEA